MVYNLPIASYNLPVAVQVCQSEGAILTQASMAEYEEKFEVKTFESSLEQIRGDLERIQIYVGSNTSNAENEEKSVCPKVGSSTEEISEDLERTHLSSGDEETIHGDTRCVKSSGDEVVVYGEWRPKCEIRGKPCKKQIYGDPRAEIPRIPCYVASDECLVTGEEIRGNPCNELEGEERFSQEQEEGDKTDGERFTRTFSQKLIDPGPHPSQSRCFK